MKNRLNFILGMFITFVICITTVNMSYASTRTDQKNATKKYYSLVKNKEGYYKIVDINGDKIKDLLWMDRSSGNYKIYTYKNGKLRRLANVCYAKGGDMFYNTKSHKVAMFRGQFGGNETLVYSVGKTSLKRIRTYDISRDRSHTPITTDYRINNKKVSKSTYRASLKSYIRGWGAVSGGIKPYNCL